MTKVCISGYYGFNNVGDEAILQSMIHELRSNFEGIDIVVLSDKPEETAATYGVEACNRWKWSEIHKALRSSDMLISGGGGLLQDVTGKKSLLYYTNIMKMAMRRKKPVFIFAQGIGPITSKWGQDHVVKVLRKAAKITVRDDASADLLQSWGLRKGRIRVTADPVLTIGETKHVWDTQRFASLLDPSRFDASNINADNETEIEICLVDQATLNNVMAENAAKIEAEARAAKVLAEEAAAEQNEAEAAAASEGTEIPENQEEVALEGETAVEEPVEEVARQEEIAEEPEEEKPIINYEDYGILGMHPSVWKEEGQLLAIFALRDWEGFPVSDIAKAADIVAEAGYKIIFLPFQYPNDIEISKKVMEQMEYVAELFDAKVPLSPNEIAVVMEEADFVVGMRLHSLIMAAAAKTPFASISYDPKVTAFVGQMGLTPTAELYDYDSITFFEALGGILTNPDEVVTAIEENWEDALEKSKSTMTLIHSLLDRIQRRSERKHVSNEERKAMDQERRDNREAFRKEMHLYDEPVAEEVPEAEEENQKEGDFLDMNGNPIEIIENEEIDLAALEAGEEKKEKSEKE